MRFERHFTRSSDDRYGDVTFEPRDAVVRNDDGGERIRLTDNLVPSTWGQQAVDILVTKYFRKAGVPSQSVAVPEDGVPEWLWRRQPAVDATFGREADARNVFFRIAGCWCYHGWKAGYFDDEESARVFLDETIYCLSHQLFSPNSPQWFNTGLHWLYGITKHASGHYRVDPATDEVVEVEDAYEYIQSAACFILSAEDNLSEPNGIMDNVMRESRIFALGSGSGSNGSNIRGADEPLSGGGRSSGFMSFALVPDRAAGAIKSGGVTRRAARLVALDLDHPDIEPFIDWKAVEEQKVVSLITGSRLLNLHFNRILQVATLDGGCDPRRNRALRRALLAARAAEIPENYLERALLLARQGVTQYKVPVYSSSWDSESYRTVSGQNANQSVSARDDFLMCVEQNREWPIYWRTELRKAAAESRAPRPQRVVRATDLFNRIAGAVWASGDPGMQFRTRMNEWHTCPKDGEVRASNPCSEYMHVDDSSCNLASVNLVPFYDVDSDAFAIDDYRTVTRIATTALDVSITMGHFPGEKIARNTHDLRQLGLGYANVGALLMRMGLPYDSEEGRATVAALTAILKGKAYQTSAEMAEYLGPFRQFYKNRDDMLRVVRNHRRAAEGAVDGYEGLTVLPVPLCREHCRDDLWAAAKIDTAKMLREGEKHGYRNAQVCVCAPTGTIAFGMGCDTTGIEPDFSLIKYKSLAGGGVMRVINQSVPMALRRLGYRDDQIEDIRRYMLGCVAVPGGGVDTEERRILVGALQHFPASQMTTILRAMDTTSDLRHVFTRANIGDVVADDVSVGGDFLNAIGLDEEAIDRLNDLYYGHETIEGAPHLRSDHLPVFDCADRPTKHGVRFIRPDAHVLMVAAAQPFFSGSLSKTVNMPHDATIDDVKRLYMLAWKTGCKCISVYRDRAKLSSPLGRESPLLDLEDAENDVLDDVLIKSTPADRDNPLERMLGEAVQTLGNGVRVVSRQEADALEGPKSHYRPLPNRRHAINQKAQVAGQPIYVTTGEYDDGTLGEVFLNCYPNGTPIQTLMNVIGRLISEALQHGVPVAELAKKLVNVSFAPSGPVAGDDHVKMAASILDYVGKYLLINYGGRDDLSHVVQKEASQGRLTLVESPEEETDENYRFLPEFPDTGATKAATAQLVRYNGEVCPKCLQATLRWTGTCRYCDTCNESTGGCG